MKFEDKEYNLKIILVEPSGPLNVGSIARLCKNFKVNQLRIVSPRCDIFSLETTKMALKGVSYINNCKIYKTLKQAILDCDLVIATCGRIDNSKGTNIESLEKVSNWIRIFKKINNLAIVFGREDKGLTNKELLLAQKIITINTDENYPSLNLSHSVSIILYELTKFSEQDNKKNKKSFVLASSAQIDECFIEIEEFLLKVGYLLPHTSNAKISKFKSYILRGETSKDELNIIRGIIHQTKWALENFNKINL